MWKKLGFRTVAEHDGTVDFKQSNGNQIKLKTQAGWKQRKWASISTCRLRLVVLSIVTQKNTCFFFLSFVCKPLRVLFTNEDKKKVGFMMHLPLLPHMMVLFMSLTQTAGHKIAANTIMFLWLSTSNRLAWQEWSMPQTTREHWHSSCWSPCWQLHTDYRDQVSLNILQLYLSFQCWGKGPAC